MEHLQLFEDFKEGSDLESLKSLTDELKTIITNIFPDSFILVKTEPGISGNKHGYIRFALGNKSEWPNGIIQNDPVDQKIFIWLQNTGGFSVESNGGSLMINPPKGSHLAYGRVKLNWRNFKGDSETVKKRIKKYFEGAKEVIKSNLVNIPDQYKEKIK